MDTTIDKLKSWIEKTGFPLEMQLCEVLKENNIPYEQSEYFTDFETNESREIDVSCLISDNTGFLKQIAFFECKHSEKPWIVLSSDSIFSGLHSYCFYSSKAYSLFLDKLSDDLEYCLSIPWFRVKESIGYHVIQAFSDKNDICFKALMNTTKASIAQNRIKNETSMDFIFPVIVVDCPIYDCMRVKGELVIKEAKIKIVNFPYRFIGQNGANVIIVNIKYIDEFIKQFKENYEMLYKLLSPDIKKIMELIKNRKIG